MNINQEIISLSENLQENYSSLNVMRFYDELSNYPVDVLFENVGYIIGEPTRGIEFMFDVASKCNPNLQEVNEHLLEVKKVIEEYEEAENEEMVEALENYSNFLQLFDKVCEVTTENMVFDLTSDIIKPVNESILDVFLKPVVESLYGNEKSVDDFYNKDNLKNSSPEVLCSVFPHLVNYCRKALICAAGKMECMIKENKDPYYRNQAFTGIIHNISSCLLETKCLASNQLKAFANIIAKEINFIQEEILCKYYNEKDNRVTNFIGEYVHSLTNARQDLLLASSKKDVINDNVMAMQPQVGADPDTDKFDEEEVTSESCVIIDTLEDDTIMESFGDEEEDIVIYSQIQMESMELNAQEAIIKFATCESISDEELIGSFKHMLECCTKYDYVCESVVMEGELVRKASLGVQKGVRKVQHGAKNMATNAKRSVEPIKKSAASVNDQFERTVDKIKQMDMEERREKVIKGGIRVNLKRIIRAGIVTAAVKAVGGWWYAAVALLGQIFVDKKLDYRIKKEVVDEIDNNMKLLDEKIDDAKSESDKQAKYQLMRQKAALEKESNRIRYSLPNTHYRNAEVVKTQQ